MDDMVNHPAHYTYGGREVIDIMQDEMTHDEFLGYCRGNAIKYLMRRNHKANAVEDIKKAFWYASKYLEVENITPNADFMPFPGLSLEALESSTRKTLMEVSTINALDCLFKDNIESAWRNLKTAIAITNGELYERVPLS